MRRQYLLLVLIPIIGALLIAAIFWQALNQFACEGQLITTYLDDQIDAGAIWGEQSFGQSFTAPYPNLDRVDIFFHRDHRYNEGQLIFRLYEIPAGLSDIGAAIALHETQVALDTIRDQRWHTFAVPTITDSIGKPYYFSISTTGVTSEESIAIAGVYRNVYPSGTATYRDVPFNADMTFRACFELSNGEKMERLMTNLTRERPGVLGYGWFYLMGFTMYGVILVVLFGYLAKELSRQ